jgi:hypothetical protein
MRLLAVALLPTAFALPWLQFLNEAPVLASSTSQTIDEHYIVVLKPGLAAHHKQQHHQWVQLLQTEKNAGKKGFKHAFDVGNVGIVHGYSGHFDNAMLAEIRKHEHVCIPFSFLMLTTSGGVH